MGERCIFSRLVAISNYEPTRGKFGKMVGKARDILRASETSSAIILSVSGITDEKIIAVSHGGIIDIPKRLIYTHISY